MENWMCLPWLNMVSQWTESTNGHFHCKNKTSNLIVALLVVYTHIHNKYEPTHFSYAFNVHIHTCMQIRSIERECSALCFMPDCSNKYQAKPVE